MADMVDTLIVRLDGKNFSSLRINKPFDDYFEMTMQNCTRKLMGWCGADIAYTQSDEVSLVFLPRIEHIFGGREFKITSLLASYMSVEFNKYEIGIDNIFDCRIVNMSNYLEYLRIRQRDAIVNSISMAANTVFSHSQLMNKDSAERLSMLMDAGIDWTNYRFHSKYGTSFRKIQELKTFTTDEIDRLPPNHDAKKNPDLKFVRSAIKKENAIW